MSNTVKLKIKRYNPDLDTKPYWKTYDVNITSESTVLSALEDIKAHQDGSLTFRRSCRHAICGSCAMMVNRRNTLVCTKPLQEALVESGGFFGTKGVITIEPLPYLPIIKDLVVDRSVFWEQYQDMRPWLIPDVNAQPQKEYRMSQAEVDAMQQAETCIMCGACYSACPIIAGNKYYPGPHALLKLFMRVMDPRDSVPDERLEQVANENGAFRCHKVVNCIDACPKGLNPALAIATLAKLALRTGKIKEERAERLAEFIESAKSAEIDIPYNPHPNAPVNRV